MRLFRSSVAARYSVAFILFLACSMILAASVVSVSTSSSLGSASSMAEDGSANGASEVPAASEAFATPLISPLAPVGTTVTATKTHTPSGNRMPGDTLTYTVDITNTGAADATAVTFSDTIDPHTTLVPGSVNSSPIAFNDSYTATGNIPITPATGLLANDIDPDTGNNTGLTVTQVQGSAGNVGNPTNTTATGIGSVAGSVTVQSNGSFTYEPPPGFTGADTFTYQITDAGGKTGSGTVTINISNMVWFIDNTSAAANSRGTFSQPFKTIAAFNAVNSGAAPNPQNGHHVVLRPASGSYAEADGINLRDSQTLTGPAVAFNTVFTADANSTSAYTTFAASTGTAATITTTAGNGVDLGSGNAVRGLNVGNTPGFFGFKGTAVGALTIATVSKTGTGGAMSVSTSGTFGATVNFGTFESGSSATSNLNLVGVTGTLGVSSGGAGFTGSAAASNAINISGGSVSMAYPGNVTKATTGALLSVGGGHSGTLTFNTGTLSATSGTGLQFDNADGAYNFNGTTTLNGGDAGVDILNGSGGTFTFGTSATITSPTGTAFNVGTSPGSPTVTYSGSITQNTAGQRVVNIDGTTSNTITFQTGTITGGASSTGVNINNANGNVTFSNGMTLGTSGSRMTNQAVTITNGGSSATYDLGAVSIFTTGASAQGIAATSFDGMLNATGVVDASGASAININGPAGLTTLTMSMTRVAANGGANGIALANTAGSFTVTGDGSHANNASGGLIQNSTGRGVSLSNVQNISFESVSIQSTALSGISGSLVTNFTLKNSTIHLSGNASAPVDDRSNVGFGFFLDTGVNPTDNNVSGVVTITGNTLTNAFEHGIDIQNYAGTISNAMIQNNTLTSDTISANTHGSAIRLLGFGSTSVVSNITKATISGNTITNFSGGAGITAQYGNSASSLAGTWGTPGSATNVILIQNNFINGQNTMNPLGANAVLGTLFGAGQAAWKIDSNGTAGNPITNVCGTAIGVSIAGASCVATADITNNHIVGFPCSGAQAISFSATFATVNTDAPHLSGTISGNTVSGQDGNGIIVLAATNSNAIVDAAVLNNNVGAPNCSGCNRVAILADSGSAAPSVAGVAPNLCLDISGNTAAGSGVDTGIGLRRESNGTASYTFGIKNLPAGDTATPNLEAYINSINPAGGGTLLFGTTNGYTSCTTAASPTGGVSTSSVNPTPDSAVSPGAGDDPLYVARGGIPKGENVQKLTPEELTWMVQAAIARWVEMGISGEDLARLQAARFEVADLPADQIAAVDATHIQIDEKAAGYGWFFDQTPTEDSEFQVLVPDRELQTTDLSPANGKMDLLSVVMRELGHVYLQSKNRIPKIMLKNLVPLMEGTLSPGVRRLPLDQLKVTPSTTGSIKPAAGGRVQMPTAATQASAAPSTTEPAGKQAETDAASVSASTGRFSGRIRHAVFNPATDKPTATGAVLRFNNASDARSYAAIRAARVGSASPFSGETVTVGPFTLPVGKSVTIMYQVTINTPFPAGVCTVTNPATGSGANVTGSNFTSVTIAPDSATVVKAVTIGSCPTNITKSTDPNVCTAVTTFTTPTADGCPVPTVTCVPASGFAFPKGTTTVTCTASNGTPPDATCMFTVTVNDTQLPTITCPAPVVHATDPNVCTAVVTYAAPSVSDNCPGVGTPSCLPASGSTFNKGVTTVTCTVMDASSNSNSCMFTVTVNDTQAPTVTCPPSGGAFAASDCLPSQSLAYTGPTLYSAGSNTVTGVVLSGFTPCTPPPVSGTATINFTGIVTGDLTIPPTASTHFQAPVTGSMKVTFNNLTGSTRTFDTEMLQLDIGAGNLPAGVLLRESPTLVSTGQTKITTVTGGFHIDSFFDVFTELSTNGGLSWTPDPTARHIATVQSTDAGACTALVNYPAATATDNCPGVSAVTCVPPSGSTFAKGTTTVSCSATDASNNPGSCSFTVTVIDTQAPTLTCPSNISVIGNVCQVETYTTPTGSDNCPGVVVNCLPASGSCFAVGTTTVTCTATDTSSNTGTCTFTVTVTPCTITCPGNVVVPAEPGVCTAVATFADPTTTGSCGTVTCAPVSGSTFQKGVTTVTCSTTAGPSCTFTVTVNDTQPPMITCPGPVVHNTDPNVCTAVVTFAAPTVTDNCPPCNGTKPSQGPGSQVGCQVVCVPASGATFNKGVTTVTCTATDASNNTAMCSFTVTVNDTQAPSIVCPANVTQSTDPNVCTAVVTYSNATATDNCPGVGTPVCTPASGTTFLKGVTTVSCTVSDASSNSSNCTFTVTINDTQPPTITCPSPITQNTDPNVCTAVVTFADPAVTDNCPPCNGNGGKPGKGPQGVPGCSVTCVPASGSTFQKGVTTVTCTATDASNNQAMCSFTVTINDMQAPSITCPSPITQGTDPNVCTAVVNFTPTATDNCPLGPTPIVCTPASGATFQKGVTTVSCTATDTSSNTANCSFTVTVNDTQAPSITCPANITQPAAAGQCSAVVTYANATATDNCPGVGTPSCVPASGSTFQKGVTTVTCTVHDASNNPASCSFTVTINDTQPPMITCPANVTHGTDPNVCTAVVTYSNATATDNCPGVGTPSCVPASGSTFPKGVTTVTCTVSDASMNSANCTFTVTVNDTQNPTVSCPANITFTTPGNFDTCGTVTYTTPTGSDNCPLGPNPVSCLPASGTCFPVGMTTVTCTVTDTSNRTGQCTFKITVQNPCTITCPANITKNNDANQCGAVVTFAPTTTGGGCGTVACSPASGSFFPKGTTTVTCTTAGPSCSFTVTVNDTQPPNITCPANIIKGTDPGVCQAVVTYAAPVVSDNCPGVGAPTCSPASGTTFPKGTTTVTCSVKDSSNNMSMCSFTVTVNDTEPPVFPNGCPAGITKAAQVTCPFTTTLNVTYTTPIATDNCGPPPTVVCTPPSGSTFPVGTTVVTCTATDSSGNTATCTFPVNIYSFCLQDDSSDFNVVFVNALTGDYLFCKNGVPLASGRGTLVAHGCNFQIDHVKGDRKVHIQGDTSVNGTGAGTAYIQKLGGGFVVQITDRNMSNDACTCGSLPPPPAPPKKKNQG